MTEMKLERLSPEVWSRVLSGEKTQQTENEACNKGQFISFPEVFRHKLWYERGDLSKFEIEGEDGSFDIQNYDNIWGSDRIDSWGNVRHFLKGHGDLAESEDWYGWWVHVDSLHNYCGAHLYGISGGVTKSCIMIWDNTKAEATPQNIALEDWKVIFINMNVRDMS